MVTRKSNREIELMRVAGRIVALAHKATAEAIKPGMSTKELNELIEKVIVENDAIPSFKNYNGFPAAACISINEEVVHGIARRRREDLADDEARCYRGRRKAIPHQTPPPTPLPSATS